MRDSARRPLAAAVLTGMAGITLALFAYHVWHFRGHLIDDTFISLRYARNLADGYGLVFNPGEYVEGYTNPSFVLLSALCFSIGLDPILVTRLLSLVAAGLVLVLVRGFENMGPRSSDRSLAPLFLIAGPALAYWSIASFETIPFTALLLAALWAMWNEGLRGAGHASVWLWLALAWTRPEMPFLFAVSTVAFALADLGSGDRPRSIARRHAINAAWVIAGTLPLLLWRLWYYGELVPNTFHAKVTGGSEQFLTGLRSLGLWAGAYPLHALAGSFALALAAPRLRRELTAHPYVPAIALIALAHIAYVTAVGGDFMPYYRFFQPTLALGSLLLAWTIAIASRHLAPARRAWIPVAALALTLTTSHATTQRIVAFVSHRTTTNGIRVGEMFGAELAPTDWIAVNTAGAIPFYSGLPAIDMLGLTDAAIAKRETFIISTGWAGHRKGWGRYVLERRPKRILWYNTAGDREPFYLGDHELAESPIFQLFYRLETRQLPPIGDGAPLATFVGTPFGDTDKPIHSPELGFASTVDRNWITTSSVHEEALMVNMFERDERLASLWPASIPNRDQLPRLVDAAVRLWQAKRAPAEVQAQLQEEIEAICEQARLSVEHGDMAAAKRLLATAAAKNERIQSPMVYQYIANVAVMAGDPFVAIAAQKEALRLQPNNQLYRRNLIALLSEPYKDLAEGSSETTKTLATDGHR